MRSRNTPGGELVPFPLSSVAVLDDQRDLPAVVTDVETLPDVLPEMPVPIRREPIDVTVRRAADYRPVLPGWARSLTELRRQCAWLGRLVAHRTGFHGVRVPLYAGRAVGYAPRGVLRVTDGLRRWCFDAEASELRWAAVRAKDTAGYLRLVRERNDRVRRRLTVVGVAGGCALVAALVASALLPPALRLLSAAGTVVALGYLGRPRGRRFLSAAADGRGPLRLTEDVVVRAFLAAKLCKPDDPIGLVTPCHRDAGGWRVVLDLPYGRGFTEAVDRKEALASGLDVAVSQVFLTREPASVRRLSMWVADTDPLARPAGKTMLLRCQPTDVWAPLPVGLDERGDRVLLDLLWNSFLIGAQPRKGKTFTARLIALFAALDPWVKLVIVDGKNSPDWNKFRLVAHRIVFGTHPNPNDPDPIGNLLAVLDEILAHIARVNEQLGALDVSQCPEGKLTRDLARDHRFPDLRVLLLVVEEFQVYFETEDQAVNKDIAAKLSRIQAVGPSAGVILVSSSQKPSGVGAGDVGRLFNRYRDNHAVRFALKCGNRIVSEAVLGGDAYAEGYDASSLPVGKEYLGVGYLYGASDETPTVHTYLADHGDAEKILHAARRLRQKSGTLTGYAVGEKVPRQVRDVLADVRGVFAGEPGLHWQTIAARLADSIPEHYADLTADTISTQLRALGVASVDVKREGLTLKGVRAAEVGRAANGRESASG